MKTYLTCYNESFAVFQGYSYDIEYIACQGPLELICEDLFDVVIMRALLCFRDIVMT